MSTKRKLKDGSEERAKYLKSGGNTGNGDNPQASLSSPSGDAVSAAQGNTEGSSVAAEFLMIMEAFSEALGSLEFGEKVVYIYNPLIYAKETHEDFINKYCQTTKKVLFLGMNPGPFGMAQNGVPFGERDHVVDWLGIEGNVGKPTREHPKRQIQGLDCPRKEVSGQRFWDLWKDLCKTPERFFKTGFVYNHCPLVFMAESGKNITPPTLPVRERNPLNQLCDRMLVKLFKLLEVEVVVGIGKFAQERARKVIADEGLEGIRVELIMHPSPANPAANKGWDGIVKKQLKDIDVLKYFVQ